jgi:(2Fe-2S) ferredoxin
MRWQPLILPSYHADCCAGFVFGPVIYIKPARPRTQHSYHQETKVKPEAATAVVELLMMGGKAPEKC